MSCKSVNNDPYPIHTINPMIFVDFDSSDDSDHTGNQQIPRSLPGETCCETFGTNSGLLMQFKYDELRESYGKSVKNVCKKDKYLRQLLNETEKLRFHNYQITEENKELNLKIANICYKYLELLDQRSEEQLQMKICVESLSSRLKK